MIRFKIGWRKYIEVPSNWNELSYSQVMRIIKCTDENELLPIVTGLKSNEKILPYLNFLKESIDVSEIEPAIIYRDNLIVDIRRKSYGQKLMLQNELKKGNVNNSICNIVAIYYMEEFDNELIDSEGLKLQHESFFELFSVALNLINQLKSINEMEAKRLSFKPSNEQLQAGIKDFDILGDFNTIDELSKYMRLTYEEIEKLEYNVVFAVLLKLNISSKFEKKYSEILSKKK